jgi:exonuclease SbcD
MKILHTSDWHLGKRLDQFSLQLSHEQFLDWLIDDQLAKEKPDLLVVAGDIYDKRIPATESIELFEEALVRIQSLGIKTLITAGNHDSRIRLGTNTRFMEGLGLHFRTRLSQLTDPVIIENDDYILAAYGIPYIEPDSDTGSEPNQWDVAPRHEDVLKYAVSLIKADVAERQKKTSKPIKTLVASHAFIQSGVPSDSERNTKVGNLGEAPSSVFDGIDYVAMGHLHGFQEKITAPGSTVLRYSGSPIAFSFSERDHIKQVLSVEMTDKGVAPKEIESREIPEFRGMVQVEGSLDEILSDATPKSDKWAKVILTDTVMKSDVVETLRRKFPNLVEFSYQRQSAYALESEGVRVSVNELRAEEVTRRFVEKVTGSQASPELGDAIDQCCTALSLKISEDK